MELIQKETINLKRYSIEKLEKLTTSTKEVI